MYIDLQQISDYQGTTGEEIGEECQEGGIVKGIERIFGSDGYVHYLDFADSFMSVYVCQNLPNSIL